MNNVDRVVELAISQLGTSEDAKGHVKYSDEYGLPCQPWCMMFLWWLYLHTGLSDIFYDGKKTASCGALYRWALSKGYVVKDGRRGDIAIFTFRKDKNGNPETSHCGLVIDRSLTGVTSIDGNTSEAGSQDNGGHVLKRVRAKRYVLAYIRLPYPDTSESVQYIVQYIVQKGDSLWKISKMFYGTGSRWKEIYEFNELTTTTLRVNQVLYIRKD